MSEHVLTEGQYWKVRAKMAEHQRVMDRANRLAAESQQALSEAMAEAGLDPAKNYRLVDETLTAILAEPAPLRAVNGPDVPDGR